MLCFGTLPTEKMVVGKLSNIERLVEQEGIRNPALIIIGEAARHVRPGYYGGFIEQEHSLISKIIS